MIDSSLQEFDLLLKYFVKEIAMNSAPANNKSRPALNAIGILTSGGDSQGMNCVLFGLVKAAQSYTDVYLIHDGYVGLVNGASSIEKANLDKLSSYVHQGGTIIGSSRCAEFRTREGRKRAAYNLITLNIQNLVIVGGDGSLTGANLLRQEWSTHVKEISNEVPERERQIIESTFKSINIVGIIGSIDNDFTGTDMTVGADSALARIVESVEIVKTTASSHHRTIVIEVMGRNCGYLALAAAFATEASFVFIPESPTNEWKRSLKNRINFEHSQGQLFHVIIMSEGARNTDGTMLKIETVKDYLSKDLNLDTRTMVLAHLQRGGNVSAFDRLMSIQLGVEAANFFCNKTCDNAMSQLQVENSTDAVVLTMDRGQIDTKRLMPCVNEVTSNCCVSNS